MDHVQYLQKQMTKQNLDFYQILTLKLWHLYHHFSFPICSIKEELMPYQQKLADEYVEASLALKAAGATAKPQ